MGATFGQIDATVSDPDSTTDQIIGVLWSAGDSRVQQALFNRQFQPFMNLPPGKYYGCAIATVQSTLLYDYAVRKALESQCAATELDEGGRATIQMPLISSAELERLIEK